ncbi:class I SAM-dependent methyltransferase [Heyndrickxia sp. NPDC080065]|uniref:class I SAM-dependent methyltransferase n=1 Tax=Heyndrickxia sp. NPDC080065 TaxID=3390568 RepID=UPI003D021A38
MIVTTAGRTEEFMIDEAKIIAKELNIPFIPRKKRSIEIMQQLFQSDCIVVGKNRLELYPLYSEKPFFFHPNSASFRIKRLNKGEKDPFIEAAKLSPGMTILDCTMGLASDSIVASFVVGKKGKVRAIEANKYLYFLVNKGLEKWESELEEMNQAMRRIETKNANYLDVLKELPEKSVDVIYFDPMFEEKILSSDGISSLRQFALYSNLNEDVLSEAKRVAKQRIILKDHFRSKRFDQYGFEVFIRKSAKFHFGIINLEKNSI